MHRTVVESLEDLTGGGYGNMRNATFNQVKVTTHNRDGSIYELHLPAHRQASAFRMDMVPFAKRIGDLQMRACWMQFQCVPTTGPGGQQGYKVSEMIEALGHADEFYSSCYEFGEKVDLYKAKMKHGIPIKDVRKKGPHYMNHM